jgi:rhodopsin domain-containing protein
MVYYGGAGRHFSDVLKDVKDDPPGWAKEIFSIVFINMYLASVSLPKLSALFFYLRVFVYRKGRVLAYIVIGLVILNWAVFSITSIFQCRPIAYWWDKTIQGGVCFNLRIYNPAMCVPNIATDVVVLLLPISSLKLPLLKRIALCFIFLTASVWVPPYMSVLFRRKLIFPSRGMFASIYRFSVVLTTDPFRDRTCTIPHIKFQNICTRLTCSKKGVAVSLIGWSIVESGMYLIAACLPLLRPVIEEKVIPKKLKVIFSQI